MKWIVLIIVFVVWFGIVIPLLNNAVYEYVHDDNKK